MTRSAGREDRARLPDNAWLGAPWTRAVLAALTARGRTVRFVGGCVRNTLLGRAVADIDIATPDPPETVLDLLGAAGIRAIPTGLAHGTVTAVQDGRSFEITTLRRDVRTFGRHAEVAFTEDWEADARRRDFTMNALYADPDGLVHDPVDGLPDLETRRVRFIGDPNARIREDYLRILRFFRFYAWYGEGPLDPEGLRAAAQEREGLRNLSAERVRDELLKLLAAPDPLPSLRAMAETGVLEIVLPEAQDLDRLARLTAIERSLSWSDSVRRLGALIVNGLPVLDAAALAERLRLSNKERDRLARMALDRSGYRADMDPAAIRAALYRLGKETFCDLALLAWAGDSQADPEAWRAVLALAEEWTPPRFPLTGADAIALGVKPGPELGRLLRETEAWWIENDFAPDRPVLRAHLAGLVGNSPD